MTTWVIGDVHGCCWTLIKLLKRLPKEDRKVFVGDLIDRGLKSFEVVMLVKAMCDRGEALCVIGNHEEFMLGVNEEWWYQNGGDKTLASYEKQASEHFQTHRNWMENLPVYLEFPDVLVGKDKRKLVVSHSCIYTFWLHRDNPKAREGILWGREFYMTDENYGIYNVFGHTPVEEPEIKEWGAMIDTGCVFGKRNKNKFGKLTAFNPETGDIVQERFDTRDV